MSDFREKPSMCRHERDRLWRIGCIPIHNLVECFGYKKHPWSGEDMRYSPPWDEHADFTLSIPTLGKLNKVNYKYIQRGEYHSANQFFGRLQLATELLACWESINFDLLFYLAEGIKNGNDMTTDVNMIRKANAMDSLYHAYLEDEETAREAYGSDAHSCETMVERFVLIIEDELSDIFQEPFHGSD